MDFLLEAVDREYERAVEALGFESAEGGYQGAHWDSADMIEQIGLDLPNDDGRLLEILVDCFGDEPWCDRNPYAQREDERLVSVGNGFANSLSIKGAISSSSRRKRKYSRRERSFSGGTSRIHRQNR